LEKFCQISFWRKICFLSFSPTITFAFLFNLGILATAFREMAIYSLTAWLPILRLPEVIDKTG
jgi:hypothetical protein